MGGRNEDYELLGAASAAAEGAEEEDGDGTGEHDARGDLQRGGVVVDGEQRRGADFHGAVPAVVDLFFLFIARLSTPSIFWPRRVGFVSSVMFEELYTYYVC